MWYHNPSCTQLTMRPLADIHYLVNLSSRPAGAGRVCDCASDFPVNQTSATLYAANPTPSVLEHTVQGRLTSSDLSSRESCDTISTTDCAARHLPVSLCLCADITASSEPTPWMSELCDNLRDGLVDEGSREDTVRSASGFLTESFNLISHGWSEGLRRRVMQHCESSSTNGSSSGRHATIPRGVVGH